MNEHPSYCELVAAVAMAARRYLGYQPWWHTTQHAPDESSGADKTGHASPVVASLPFAPHITGLTPSGDNLLITARILILWDYLSDRGIGM
jgi:hypothetical protein